MMITVDKLGCMKYLRESYQNTISPSRLANYQKTSWYISKNYEFKLIWQSGPVVMPCLNIQPELRPSAKHVVSVIDKMIQKSVIEIKKLLPPQDQEILKQRKCRNDSTLTSAECSNNNIDTLDTELVVLYRHLLTKPAQEVDTLMEKAFGFSIREQEEKAKSEAAVSLEQQPQQQQQYAFFPHALTFLLDSIPYLECPWIW